MYFLVFRFVMEQPTSGKHGQYNQRKDLLSFHLLDPLRNELKMKFAPYNRVTLSLRQQACNGLFINLSSDSLFLVCEYFLVCNKFVLVM